MPKRSVLPFLFILLIIISAACNAPTGGIRTTLAFDEQDLRQTAEAILASTPPEDLTPETSTPESVGRISIWPTLIPTAAGEVFAYRIQPGDTLVGIAGRFGVDTEEIQSTIGILHDGYLESDLLLKIPKKLERMSSAQRLLPDSELVYSPSAIGFDVKTFVLGAGGYLSTYTEILDEEEIELTGAEIIQRVASELSVNPRLLLAFLDYRSEWVFNDPLGASRDLTPVGFNIPGRSGLYEELKIAATQLNLAYYGWRDGTFHTLSFEDDSKVRLDPTLNAGSVALMHLFAILSDDDGWREDLYAPDGFPVHYYNIFGDPWSQTETFGPLIPAGLVQPELELPFLPYEGWSLTAGPHYAWNTGTPYGALDFSPILVEETCATSAAWVTASAPGVVVRARDNVVALDLDGDGYEGSGWVVIYYHIAEDEMIPEGLTLGVDQRLGHPSCEGGTASGTHVHVSRKFNGEWIAADGPIPFVMSGWWAVAGERIYQGQLVKGDQVVTADPAGRAGSTIIR